MRDLTVGKESRLIFLFALPMLIGNVFQQMYNLVDSLVVGRFVGTEALAAVGVSFPILFLLIALVMGMTMGSTVILSQYYGAKDMERVRRTIETTTIFLFLSCLVITAAGLLSSEAILRLLRTPPKILSLAKLYLTILFAGMVFLFGFNSLSAILRGLGDSKTPLYFLIVSTLINIALDLLFVLVFRWGVAGVAWATVIAQGVSFLLGVLYIARSPKYEALHLDLRRMRFDREIFRHSIRIGLPSAVQQVLVAMGMMALSRIVNGFGTKVIAAYTAAGRLDSFAMMPAMNFSIAISAFVGQNLGANKPERVKRGYLSTQMMSGVVALSITAVMIMFRGSLIRLFNTDPEVVRIGSQYLLIVGSAYLVFSLLFINNGVLRGAGDTIIPMFVTLIALWAVRVPVAALLSRSLGPDGIWLSTPIGWVVGLVLNTAYYMTGRWMRKVIVKPMAQEAQVSSSR